MYEGGHRVPFIASWPGEIPPGSTSEATVMTMDFFPTFAKLAGVASPADLQIDGMDMMPLLTGDTTVHDRPLHWLFGDSWAVRKGPWKLIGQGERPRELVDVEKDIGEQRSYVEERPDRVKELTKLHEEWVEEVGGR